MILKEKTDTTKHEYWVRPVDGGWIRKHFGQDVAAIQLNLTIYADLRMFCREDIDYLGVVIERPAYKVFGEISGIELRVKLYQSDEITIVTFKDGTVKTLCNISGWRDGPGCNCNDCMIREVHAS